MSMNRLNKDLRRHSEDYRDRAKNMVIADRTMFVGDREERIAEYEWLEDYFENLADS